MPVLLSHLRHSQGAIASILLAVHHDPPRKASDMALQWLLGLSLVGTISTPVLANQAHPIRTSDAVLQNASLLAQAGSPPAGRIPQPATEADPALAPLVPETSAPATIDGEDTDRNNTRLPSTSQGDVYKPVRLNSGLSIEDTLTTKDIPMGQGSFARDYLVTLKAEDQIAIDLSSDNFDTVVTLMSKNGTTLGENDDGPDGGTNSLLFMRITEDGDYVVRVRGFGQAKGGPFKLKLTRLKAIN